MQRWYYATVTRRLRAVLALGLLGLLALTLTSPAQAQLANSGWPAYQGSYGESGQGIGAGASPTLKWQYLATGMLYGLDGCALGTDGTVYLTDYFGNVYALNPESGALKWTFTNSYGITEEPPEVGSNGDIYVEGQSALVALNSATGEIVWTFQGVIGPFAVGQNGTIYAYSAAQNGGLYAVNGDSGAKEWFVPFDTSGIFNWTPPAIGPDGSVYVAPDYVVYAFNANGTLKWSFTDPNTATYQPSPPPCSVGPDGTVYAVDWQGCVFALDATSGAIKWQRTLTGGYTSAAIGSNGIVYAVAGGYIYALSSASGATLWSDNVGGYSSDQGAGFWSPAAIAADGTVYMVSGTNTLYALNGSTGAINWVYQVIAAANDALGPAGPQAIATFSGVGPLSIGADGSLYVPTYANRLFAFASAGLSVSFMPSPVPETSDSTGTITLNSPAPAGGTVVALSSDNTHAQMPATVTVPAGATTATFTVTTSQVTSKINVHVTAQQKGALPFLTTLTIVPLLGELVLSPASVLGGSGSTGTIYALAPVLSDTTVHLSSSSSSAQIATATCVIPAGWSTASFKISTSPVTTTTTAAIVAQFGSDTLSAPLSIVGLKGVSVSPQTVAGGTWATGTVTLTAPAPSNGVVIDLASNSSSATVPSVFTVRAGSASGTFTVKTTEVASATSAKVTAKLGTVSDSTTLTIVTPSLSSIATDANAVVNGGKLDGIVRLSGPALSQTTIPLQVSNSKFASVTSATVPAGSAVGTFTITTTSTPGGATISGTYGGVSRTSNVFQVVGVKGVTYNPNSAPGGDRSEGLVTLTAGLPMNVSCSLSSSSPLVVAPANVSIGSGAFVLTTRPVATNTVVKVTAKLAGSSASGTFTVLAPKITSFTVSPTSVQGSSSTTVTGTIQLSGPPPGGFSVKVTSSDPAAASVASPVTFNGTTGTFTVAHSKVTVGVNVTLGVVLNGLTSSATLAVTP